MKRENIVLGMKVKFSEEDIYLWDKDHLSTHGYGIVRGIPSDEFGWIEVEVFGNDGQKYYGFETEDTYPFFENEIDPYEEET
jgi:hypothetical protein